MPQPPQPNKPEWTAEAQQQYCLAGQLIPWFEWLGAKLDAIAAQLSQQMKELVMVDQDVTDLQNDFATLQTAVSGAVTQLKNFQTQLANAAGDAAAVEAVAQGMGTLATNLNNAVNPPQETSDNSAASGTTGST